MKRTGRTLIDVDTVNLKITGRGRVQIGAVELRMQLLSSLSIPLVKYPDKKKIAFLSCLCYYKTSFCTEKMNPSVQIQPGKEYYLCGVQNVEMNISKVLLLV